MTPVHDELHDTFRNELASVASDGRRRWVYARQPSGRLYRARTVVGVVLLMFLLLAPFIRVGNQPLMMLNVLERRFVLLGVFFPPQDLSLVVLLALVTLVTVMLATVLFGRVWCGWLCPQTVFMEMVFRRIEYGLAGSAQQQLRRSRGPWSAERLRIAAIKHAVFVAVSFVIANVFLAWVIGADAVKDLIVDMPARHPAGFAAMVFFTSVFYLVFARFREQACVLACPYGRMLSSLVDRRTVTVMYDAPRGEPRGRLKLPAGSGTTGDCVDCHRCVTVCPTGIDIRNGIQLECVSCTACIDECGDVMQRLGRPAGLIRHTSADVVNGAPPHWFTPRVAGYAVVWLTLIMASARLLWMRPDLDVLVLRQPGTLYVKLTGGEVANLYSIQALNRTARPAQYAIDILQPRGAVVTQLGELGPVDPYTVRDARFMIRAPGNTLAGPSTPVRLRVRPERGPALIVETSFLSPPGGGED